MQRSISGSDFSSGFRLIRNDIFFDFLDNPKSDSQGFTTKHVNGSLPLKNRFLNAECGKDTEKGDVFVARL